MPLRLYPLCLLAVQISETLERHGRLTLPCTSSSTKDRPYSRSSGANGHGNGVKRPAAWLEEIHKLQEEERKRRQIEAHQVVRHDNSLPSWKE